MRVFLSFILLLPLFVFSQNSEVAITALESNSSEPVSFAEVKLVPISSSSNGEQHPIRIEMADEDGIAMFTNVPYGNYKVTITMLDSTSKEVTVNEPKMSFKIEMKPSIELEEVEITASFIKDDRRTPISVTRINPKKIEEELGSRDIPMLLNATPGVYATQQGGGEGDARVTVRGFSQRNVGVMIDGVPVNDMENGAVYWSNWFGLDAIMEGIQVQRGLGASKISMPSVGGTINILTQGLSSKRKLNIKQEYGTGEFIRTSVGFNSGLLKGGWGVTVAASFKKTNGWVDGTPSIGGFYYGKIQKRIKNHLLSVSVFGAPQKHAQRAFNQRIQYWDSTEASKFGADFINAALVDKGIRFNEHWGYISKGYDSKNVFKVGQDHIMAERLNYFNKNQFTLKDFWSINKKVSLSNIVYASVGNGGGTKLYNYSSAPKDENGQLNWDAIIKNNQEINIFGDIQPTIDPFYSPDLLKSSNVITSSVNNHYWIGYLGQLNYKIDKHWEFSGGLDYRYYRGEHYREITDLLGGDYFVNGSDKNAASPMKKKGDKIADAGKGYEDNRLGYVQWAGAFGQIEFTSTRWTAFANVTGNYNGYMGVDKFQKKVLELGDTIYRIGYGDTVNVDGNTYTIDSKEAKYRSTGYQWIPGATIKLGGSYKIAEHSSIYVNAGYLSRTPQYTNVVDNATNDLFGEIKNEIIQAVELGYNFNIKKVAFSVNGYFTNWKNKPFPNGLAVPDPLDPMSTIRINVQGMDAIHAGVEFDGVWKIIKQLELEANVSYGDWRWNSSKTVKLPAYNDSVSFDAKGVHVGDAPQSMYAVALRYEPIKNLYFKVQYQYFDRFYSEFNPFILKGDNAGRESWKAPAYGLLNIYAGYKYIFNHKYALIFNGNVTNVLNSKYISDAILSSTYGNTFDVNSVGVMYGMGLRFNLSLGFQF